MQLIGFERGEVPLSMRRKTPLSGYRLTPEGVVVSIGDREFSLKRASVEVTLETTEGLEVLKRASLINTRTEYVVLYLP
jgi:hypothetical protein